MKDYRIVFVYSHHHLKAVAIKRAGKLAAQMPPGSKRLPRVEYFNGEGWIDLKTNRLMSLQLLKDYPHLRAAEAVEMLKRGV